MVADYRYYFGSLRSDGVIAEIPLYGTYMDLELVKGGQFNGTFQLDQTGKRNQDLIDATIPGHNYVMVERNGVVIWGGFLWSRTYQSQSKDVQLYAQSFEKFPNYQLVVEDFTSSVADQRTVFCEIWNNMQAVAGRNLGINIPTTVFEETVLAQTQVLAIDREFYGETMAKFTDAVDGFDWYISCHRIGDKFIKNLIIGNPKAGQPQGANNLVFQYPGSITNYYLVESMAEAATHMFVLGSGDGSEMILGTASSVLVDAFGWPRWDFLAPHKDITSNELAQLIAEQELATRLAPKTTLKATMKGDLVPEFGSWGMGDSVKVVVKDPRNPDGLNFFGRIAKWTLQPPTGTNVEEYTLIFVGDDS